jgi:hypothetical protein
MRALFEEYPSRRKMRVLGFFSCGGLFGGVDDLPPRVERRLLPRTGREPRPGSREELGCQALAGWFGWRGGVTP